MAALRRAVEADLSRIREIRLGVVENRLSRPDVISDRTMRRYLDRHLFHVAEENGLVTGFSAAEPDDGSVWALFVEPGAEGRGIGRALLDAALADLRRAGWRQAWLSTDPGTRAAGFYEKAGWIATGATDNGEIRFEISLG